MTHRLTGPQGQFQSTADEQYARLLEGAGWRDTPHGWKEVPVAQPEPKPEPARPDFSRPTVPAQAVDRLPYWLLALTVFGLAIILRVVWLVWTLGGAR